MDIHASKGGSTDFLLAHRLECQVIVLDISSAGMLCIEALLGTWALGKLVWHFPAIVLERNEKGGVVCISNQTKSTVRHIALSVQRTANLQCK